MRAYPRIAYACGRWTRSQRALERAACSSVGRVATQVSALAGGAAVRTYVVGAGGHCRWRVSVMPSVHLSAMGPGHAVMLIIWNALQLLACAGCVYSAFGSNALAKSCASRQLAGASLSF